MGHVDDEDFLALWEHGDFFEVEACEDFFTSDDLAMGKEDAGIVVVATGGGDDYGDGGVEFVGDEKGCDVYCVLKDVVE